MPRKPTVTKHSASRYAGGDEPRRYEPGALVTVYSQWPGVVKGAHTATSYVVQYQKHGGNLVAFVEASKLKPRKAK